MAELSHFDESGAAHMVDVSDKAVTSRVATAKGRVVMATDTLAMISEGRGEEGRCTVCSAFGRDYGGEENA